MSSYKTVFCNESHGDKTSRQMDPGLAASTPTRPGHLEDSASRRRFNGAVSSGMAVMGTRH